MAGVLGAASIPFIGCVSLLVAMILQILAFASPFWATKNDPERVERRTKFGLWKVQACNEIGATNDIDRLGCRLYEQKWDEADYLQAVRGLESLAILFWSLPLVILPVYIYVALGLKYRSLLGTMTFFTWLGAVCNIIGVIIFAVEVSNNDSLDAGWCLIVCGVAFVPGIIAFLIFLLATFKRPKFKQQSHYVSGFYVDPDKNQLYVVENVEPPAVIIQKPPPSALNGVDNPVMVVN